LVLSTLATTSTIAVRWTVRGPTAATGLVQPTPGRMLTSCTSLVSVSAIMVSGIVASVTLFAASGGERREDRDIISLEVIKLLYRLDENMAYVVAACHDIGLSINRENHETESSKNH